LSFDKDILCWGLPQYIINIPVSIGSWYVWDKTLQNNLKVKIAECEFCWHKNGTKSRIFRHLWSGAYKGSESGIKSEHPTQKPIILMEWCIDKIVGNTICDPYMGSGTTGVACLNKNKQFIGIEIDEKYFDIACNRISSANLEPWKYSNKTSLFEEFK